MNVNQVINYCIGLDLYPLENFAGKNFTVVYDYIKSTSSANPNDILVPTIFTCIAANGQFTQGEWDFIMSFVGNYSYNEAVATAGEFHSTEARRLVSDLAHRFPSHVREAYVSMCIAVLAVDKRVDGPEIEFLRTLL